MKKKENNLINKRNNPASPLISPRYYRTYTYFAELAKCMHVTTPPADICCR